MSSRLPGRPVFPIASPMLGSRFPRPCRTSAAGTDLRPVVSEPGGTDQLIDGFRSTRSSVLPQALHGSGNVVGETDRFASHYCASKMRIAETS